MTVSARRRIEQQTPRNDRLTWMEPHNTETDLSFWTTWWTTCRRYRVVLSVSKYGMDTVFYAAKRCKRTQQGLTKDSPPQKHVFFNHASRKHETYKYLETALKACEDAHCRRFKMEFVESNADAVLSDAARDKLDRITVVGHDTTRPGRIVKAPTGEPREGRARINMLGHPVTAVLRFMGKDEFSFAEARKVCDAFGVEVADNTIRAQLAAGKKGERGPAAVLTQKQVDEIYSCLEE